MEEQVAVMFAGVNGHLDAIDTKLIRRFEKEYLAWLRGYRAALLGAIREKRGLDDAAKTQLTQALEEFKKTFKP
jgi:F-type H+-transporting ATPase subunit alpha